MSTLCVARHLALTVAWMEETLALGRDQDLDSSPGSATRTLGNPESASPFTGLAQLLWGDKWPRGRWPRALGWHAHPAVPLPSHSPCQHVWALAVTDIPHSFLTATSSSCKTMSFCSEPASLEDTYGLSLWGAGSILCGLKLMAAFC